jgi:hypothetical protein
VQVVSEFEDYRAKILKAFGTVIKKVSDATSAY